MSSQLNNKYNQRFFLDVSSKFNTPTLKREKVRKFFLYSKEKETQYSLPTPNIDEHPFFVYT